MVVNCDVSGRKRFLALESGVLGIYRELENGSAEPTGSVGRGVKAAKLAVGDDWFGIGSALAEVYPKTRALRCRGCKTANVLYKLLKRIQGEVKSMPHETLEVRHLCEDEGSVRVLPSHLGSEVSHGRRMLGEGPRGNTCLLRLPSEALAEPSDDEPHRVDFRHDTFVYCEYQELTEREDGTESGSPPRHEHREAMEPATRLPSSGRRDLRREVHRWSGRKRNRQEGR